MRPLKDLLNLQGRVALITGGAGHIGQAMAEALAEQGARIVILDREPQAAAQALAEAHGVEVLSLAIDLEQEAEVRAIPERVLEVFGRLDILIHCAAFAGTAGLPGWITPFLEQRVDTWRRALEVNLTAPFLLTQLCVPALRASGHGSIIHISSLYGVVGPDMRLYEDTAMGNPAAYGASKGGLLQLNRWLSTVLAPEVRVNAISPGGLWRGQPEAFVDRYVARTPLGRMGTEEDFKGVAAFLASDASAYITGQNLVVDGGFTAW